MSRYDIYVKTYSEDRIIVSQNSKWGVIDNNNNVIIPIIYEDVQCIKDEAQLFKVKQGEQFNYTYGLYDKEGKELLPPIYDKIYDNGILYCKNVCPFQQNGKYGILFINTGKIIDCKFESISMSYYNEDTFYAKVNGLWGMYDDNGEEIFAPQYTNAFYSNGLYICYKGKMCGLLNESQDVVVDFIYNNIKGLSDDTYLCEKSGKKGLLRADGSIIVPCEYETIEHVERGIFKCAKRKGKFCVVSVTNNIVTQEKYDKIQYVGKYIYVCAENKQTILNEKGEERFPLIYDGIFGISEEPELFRVFAQGRYGIIDAYGNCIVKPQYHNIEMFKYGFSVVTDEHYKIGLIDLQCYEILPPIYDHIDFIDAEYVKVKRKNKYGLLYTNGKIILPAIYDEIFKISENIAEVQINGHDGIAYLREFIL